MEVVGIGFNSTCLNNYQAFLQDKILEIKTKAENMLGHTINLTSPVQVFFNSPSSNIQGRQSYLRWT